jgi:hypothetical protein
MVLADWEGVLQSVPGILTTTLIFGGWIIVAVTISIAKNWRKIHESEHAAALKQSMIERGMSADDIERVLRAGPRPDTSEGEERGESPRKVADDLTGLAGKLAEHDVPAAEMEQILGAVRGCDPGTRKCVAKTVETMLDNGANSEQVAAAVRAIARPASNGQPGKGGFVNDPASFRHG